MDSYYTILLLGLGCVSFLYASVGHGGASGYLALMSLFSFTQDVLKPTALVLNCLVSIISFLFFYKQQFFKWKLFYPFAITSVPFAFLGGLIKIQDGIYHLILGIVLLLSVARLVLQNKQETPTVPINTILALFFGALIGFISGLLGIGGGVLLSPLLLLLGWASLKESAPVSALFIFVNSIAGLLGFIYKGQTLPLETITFVPIALLGGTLGAFYGSKKYTNLVLKKILACVMLIAIFKLISSGI